jgi:ribosomal-protein-alanine N-acetyltransferase
VRVIDDVHTLGVGVRMRPVVLADAAAMAEAYQLNRAHLAPWEPRRPERFFTFDGQHDLLAEQVELRDAGRLRRWVMVDGDRIVGAMNLANIILGPFRTGSLGYWIDGDYTGRGLATAAVDAVCRLADGDLGLHRVDASTVLENAGSQRVLAKCGFEEIGMARNYLNIDGTWRDHRLFQRILNDRPLPG